MKDQLLQFIKDKKLNNAYVLLYFYDEVVIGSYTKPKLENDVSPNTEGQLRIKGNLNANNLIEVHIFNTEIEYRGNNLDNLVSITDKSSFEEEMYLIGKDYTIDKDGYTTVTQNGRKMIVPFSINPDKGKVLVVQHLFSDNGTYIKGYRLVDFKDGE